MENLPLILVALACPIGMALMMLLMGRGMMGMGRGEKPAAIGPDTSGSLTADPEKRMALLQAQWQLLDAHIAAAEESELEGRRGQAMTTSAQTSSPLPPSRSSRSA